MQRYPSLLAFVAPVALASIVQAGDLSITRSGGALGELLTYTLSGDPLETFYLVPSISQGPLPVALFCPGDPRVIQVGTELQSLATLGFLDGGGNGAAVYPVPNDPAFQGLPFFSQVMTLFGPGCLIDDLSTQNAYTLAAHDTVHNTVGNGITPRQGHTVTALDDGRVLLAGGDEADPLGNLTTLDTLEIFDPQTQRFTLLTTTLLAPRATHTATKLADGRVLFVGGYTDYNDPDSVVPTAEIYDPVADTVVAAASMSVKRTQHTTTRLADGRVFVATGGAKFDLSDILSSLGTAYKSTEVYDPVANTWTAGPDVPLGTANALAGQAASLLGNGQVLLTGGAEISILFGLPVPAQTDKCYRYDPSSNSFLATPPMPDHGTTGRVYHGQVTLPDGRAVVVGGADGDFLLGYTTITHTCRYDPVTNSWTTGSSLNSGRAYPNVLVAGDEVVVIGGLSSIDILTGTGTPEQAIEVAPFSLLGWTSSATMLLPREVGRAAAVEGGDRVLIAGTGDNGMAAVDKTAEVYVR